MAVRMVPDLLHDPLRLDRTRLVCFVIYSFIGLFSPRVKLTVSSASALPGAKIQLNWTLHGQVRRVPRLQIYLEGREEATYTRGTSSCTDKAVFANCSSCRHSGEFSRRLGQRRTPGPGGRYPFLYKAHTKSFGHIRKG